MGLQRKANETWLEFYQRKWDAHEWSRLDPNMPEKLEWLGNILELPINRDLYDLLIVANKAGEFFTVVFDNPKMWERVHVLENLLDPERQMSGAAITGIWMNTSQLLMSRQRERV